MDIRVAHRGSHDETALLYFSGWGTTTTVVDRLELPDEWTLIVASDYRGEEHQEIDLSHYTHSYLVAWSMGVWAAEHLCRLAGRPERAVAVNGTPNLISDDEGISREVYAELIKDLDEKSYHHFLRQMCLSKGLYKDYLRLPNRPTVEEAREELVSVWEQYAPIERCRIPWTRALISSHDLVVPPDSQRRFWTAHEIPCTTIEAAPHLVFLDHFMSWEEILGPS